MIILTYLVTFFILYLSPCSNGSGLGKSSCLLYSNQDVDCHLPLIPLGQLPPECTSFVFDGFVFDTSTGIKNSLPTEDAFAITQRILKCTEKSLFIVIGHQYFQGWNTDLDPQGNNAKTDIEHMKKFLTQYDNKIAGFIFKWILVGIPENFDPTFMTRLNAYIVAFKTAFPNLQFGVMLWALALIKFSDPLKLDLCANTCADFCVLNFDKYNDCTHDTCGGLVPLKSVGGLNSLECMTTKFLSKTKAKKDKIYFEFYVNVYKPVCTSYCLTTYNEVCQKPHETKDWCVGSSCSLEQQGKFSSEYGGFIAANVDLDDANGNCGCAKKFPAFHYILDGFQGATTECNAATCPKFNRKP